MGRLSEDEQKRVSADYQALSATPGVTPGAWMEPPELATTVRVDGDKTLTTDGPFVALPPTLRDELTSHRRPPLTTAPPWRSRSLRAFDRPGPKFAVPISVVESVGCKSLTVA